VREREVVYVPRGQTTGIWSARERNYIAVVVDRQGSAEKHVITIIMTELR